MYLCYIDEAGDDGYPNTSSPLFAFSMLYMDRHEWKENWERIRAFRRELKEKFGIPIGLEFHTKDFITDKNPFRQYNLSVIDKRRILAGFVRIINTLELRVISVVINKNKIQAGSDYDVFDNALTYATQRIENDLIKNCGEAKFLMITDEGRLSKTVKTTRRIQRINFIPSMFSDSSYRKEIKRLIEDPLSKNSSDSWFIQLADLVVTIVYYYKLLELGVGVLPKRVANVLQPEEFGSLLDIMKLRLNTAASRFCKYGIATYPK
jgi:hypothetical protein